MTTCAKLIDGSIITLTGEYPDGPAWLHDNDMTARMLERDYRAPIDAIIARGPDVTMSDVRHCEVLFAHYAERQSRRLGQLKDNMQRLGIVELIREAPNERPPMTTGGRYTERFSPFSVSY